MIAPNRIADERREGRESGIYIIVASPRLKPTRSRQRDISDKNELLTSRESREKAVLTF